MRRARGARLNGRGWIARVTILLDVFVRQALAWGFLETYSQAFLFEFSIFGLMYVPSLECMGLSQPG